MCESMYVGESMTVCKLMCVCLCTNQEIKIWAQSLRVDVQQQLVEQKEEAQEQRTCAWDNGGGRCGRAIPETAVCYVGSSGGHEGKLVCPKCARLAPFKGIKATHYERQKGKKRRAQQSGRARKQKRAKRS